MTGPTSTPHLLSWLEAPPPDHALRFSDGRRAWHSHPYTAMARQVRRNAHRLRQAGISSGDVVLVLGQNTIGFVTTFYGILHAGATPAIVAPVNPDTMTGRLKHVIDSVSPAAFLATADQVPFLESVAGPLGCQVLAEAPADPGSPMDEGPSRLPEVALIQFSSGSSGEPRAVQIPWAGLNTHVLDLRAWLSLDGDSRSVSWVPFYHDMGLVGCLLLPVTYGCSSSYMSPQEFIGQPLRWLREISDSRGTASAVAAFALDHVLRRVRPEQLAGLDLSSVRSMIVGAERVDPEALDALHQLLAPVGLAHSALLPAYGMAEATLAVTGVRPDAREIHTQLVDTNALAIGKPVPVCAADTPSATRLISCGKPLTEVAVDVLDDEGELLPEGTFGEIAVRGASLAAGYRQGDFVALGDRHRSGDMGFMAGGELYVVGRAGDSVKVNGRWLFAEDVQDMAAAMSPQPRQTVALLGTLSGDGAAVIVVKNCTVEQASEVGRAVVARLPELRTVILRAPRGSLRRTTSGKPKRRAMWQELVMSDDLASHTVWDSLDPDAPR
ncbi:AMP-binding protein [Streptomyces sp. NPDC059340]|uniref:AMP-binding protein n=1 Tax=Streptomyces sp. NPDC059340 TaxID=3346806 RepID=UPI0036A996C1